ncbi:MAG: LacI family transcriptional regulator [Sphaerisporangium sp.]|nr:LacI family transcriptional regulator [Sphaerisporangium sp.]
MRLTTDTPVTATLRALSAHDLGTMSSSEIAIVGFDDFELADLLTPSVTVIAQDPVGLGRMAAELLFRRLAGDNGLAERIRLPTHLIPRGSGKLPPRRN